MNETESRGVQRLPWKFRQFWIVLAIDLITHQRMMNGRHVYADLMRPSGFQRTFHKRGVGE